MRMNAESRSPSHLEGFRFALFVLPLFLLVPVTAQINPEMRDEGDRIILENDQARLVLNRRGLMEGLFDKQTGMDYLDHTYPVHFLAARKGRVEFGSSSLVRQGDLIQADFEGSGLTATVRVGVRNGYFTIEVISVNQTTLDEFIVVDLPLTISERVARVQEVREHSETINVCRNRDFGVSVMSVNVIADSRPVRYEPAAFRSSCYPRFGMEGAKVAIAAGPADQLLDTIGRIEIEQGMAHPTLGGVWGKVSKEAKKSYLFVDFTEHNIDRVIRLAKAGGFGYIMNYLGTWAKASGKHEINLENFPHGFDGLKSVMDKIHGAGLKGGAHVLSGCVSKNDKYVTPVPDPRLAKDDMRILAEDITATDTTLPLTASPEGLPIREGFGFGSGVSLVIEDEIITYAGMSTEPPFALTGCTRGAYGTVAAPHAKGAKVFHLAQRWSRFAVGGDNGMLEELAQNVADVINFAGFDMMYFDGLDGVEVNGPLFYYVGRLVSETAKRFDREVLIQGSNLPHFGWHNFSRLYTIDFSVVDQKHWVDHHCRNRMANAKNNLMPAELGWFGYFLETPSSESTTPDIIEYVLAKTVGWDVAWSLETRTSSLENHGRTDEILSLAKTYEELRLSNYFSDQVKEVLRTPEQDFKLKKDNSGQWQIHPIRYGPAKRLGHQDSRENVWTLMNEYGSQDLKVRLEAWPSPATFGQRENIVLADTSGVAAERWHNRPMSQDWRAYMRVELTTPIPMIVKTSSEQVKTGASSLRLSAQNDSAKTNCWAAKILRFEEPIDLTRNRALGFWVYGDGSGAYLDVRLDDAATRFARDHVVHLNFSGWRYCEFPEPTGGEIFHLSLPGYDLAALRNFTYDAVGSVTLFLTDVPPQSRVEIYLSNIEALRETPTTLRNPTLEVNGRSIVFPGTLENNQYLEFWGEGKATIYGKNGHTISAVTPRGQVPELRAGENRIEYRTDSYQRNREQVRIEVITMGEAIPNR